MKGDVAKQTAINKIKSLFGDDWIGKADNGKFYFWENDGLGQRVQLCFTLSCPKNEVEVVLPEQLAFAGGGIDFEATSEPVITSSDEYLEPSEEEKDNIRKLAYALGL